MGADTVSFTGFGAACAAVATDCVSPRTNATDNEFIGLCKKECRRSRSKYTPSRAMRIGQNFSVPPADSIPYCRMATHLPPRSSAMRAAQFLSGLGALLL